MKYRIKAWLRRVRRRVFPFVSQKRFDRVALAGLQSAVANATLIDLLSASMQREAEANKKIQSLQAVIVISSK